VWSWDIAAKALEANIPGFNRLFPNVRVRVLDLGNQATYDRGLAGCAAGGGDLPDVYSVENNLKLRTDRCCDKIGLPAHTGGLR